LGFEDYVNQDVWIFIEWPEKIPSFLPQDVTEVHLKIFDSETRELLLS
jgi:tRNA threonylcarbamoyladenosine biosynthesis protein TsaE